MLCWAALSWVLKRWPLLQLSHNVVNSLASFWLLMLRGGPPVVTLRSRTCVFCARLARAIRVVGQAGALEALGVAPLQGGGGGFGAQ